MTRSLYGNSESLPTMLGGGAHGHVGMIMKDTLHATIAPTAWAHPRMLTAFVVSNKEMGAHCKQLKGYKYKEHCTFDNATNIDEAFKNQIIEAVDDTYILDLKGKYTAFMDVTTSYLLSNLMDRYGNITLEDLEEN